jgi:hypothetical protein
VVLKPVAHVHLELALDADPIAGLIHGEEGQSIPFSGWMELARTLELSLAEARSAARPPGSART